MRTRKSLRFVSLFLLLLLFCQTFSILSAAEVAEIPSMDNVEAVCVLNTESKTVVISKNENKPVFPASTVKLMTALVAEEYFRNMLYTKITVTAEMTKMFSGRVMALKNSEVVTVEDMLYAMLVGGYNDAAIVLAFAVSGGVDEFVVLMNEKAKNIGALNTSYTNPTGLHSESMVTTAYDTALVGLEVMKNETLLPITKKVKYEMPKTNLRKATTIYNRNPLLGTAVAEGYYYSYAEGLNAGSTDEGGDCVVTGGKLDGLSYVVSVMGGKRTEVSPDTNYSLIAAKNILKYSLVNFSVVTLKDQREIISKIPVIFSAVETEVSIKMTKSLSALINSGIDIQKDVEFITEYKAERLEAPIREGEVVGKIKAVLDGEVLDEADLVTTKSIESHAFLVLMSKIKNFTTSLPFLLLVVIAIALALLTFVKRVFLHEKGRHRIRRRFDDISTNDSEISDTTHNCKNNK